MALRPVTGSALEQELWIAELRALLLAVPAFARDTSALQATLKAYFPGSPFVNTARHPAREAWLVCCAQLDGADLQEALECLATHPALMDSADQPLIRLPAAPASVLTGLQ